MTGTQTKEMKSAEKPILLLDQRAGFFKAREIAAENGGRLPTKSEFIKTLKDPKQYERFKGDWYWLSDECGLCFSGYAKIDYENGDILHVSKEECMKLPKEQRAYSWKGKGPVAIGVDHGYDDMLYLVAGDSLEGAARVAFVKLDGALKVANIATAAKSVRRRAD